MAAPIALAIDVKASPEALTKALTTGAGLASFWTADSQAEPQVGSLAVFGFGTTQLTMRVDELSAGERLTWTCLSDFPMAPYCWEGTTVTWVLTQSDHGDTHVLFLHGGWPQALPQAEVASPAFTWAMVLSALKAYAETGTAAPVFARPPVEA
jgi:uncharacterized protein YndB with AHSA1/START domain